MEPGSFSIKRMLFTFSAGLLVVSLAACHTSQGDKVKVDAVAQANASPRTTGPGILLQCAADRVQKPPTPFHWSLKKNVTDYGDSDREADLTLDTITGTLTDSAGIHPIHAVRSDASSWSTAVLMLAGPLPASTFALVVNSSAMQRDGTEKLNGEDTIHYSIDTARDTPEDAALINNVLGPKGFVKGTVWVLADGCPVKFLVDVEQHTRNGEIQKEHYEEAMVKQ